MNEHQLRKQLEMLHTSGTRIAQKVCRANPDGISFPQRMFIDGQEVT